MNRKQRRAAGRWPSASDASGSRLQGVFTDGVRHHQLRSHADNLHLQGVAAFQRGRFDHAIELIAKALAFKPDYPEALNTLGNALVSSTRLDDGVASYRKAIGLKPNYADAHFNLGQVLLQQGKLDQAAASYRKALQFRPGNIEALLNLGNILGDLGKPDEAIACYRRALAFSPDFPEAHISLGVTLCGLGRLDEAIESYRRALKIKPDLPMALNNLASALLAQGKQAAALAVARRSLQIEESTDAKGLFVSCLSRAHGVAEEWLRPLMVRALSECWGWPSDLGRVCIDLVKRSLDIAGCIDRAVEAWPRPLPAQILYGDRGLAALEADRLLATLLGAAPVCDLDMERFLTAARQALLDTAHDTSEAHEGLGFYSSLARQCFINEYVFAVGADEAAKARDLRDRLSMALEADAPVSALLLVAVAAYFPLCSLPRSACLPERSWPQEIAALLTQQVREPAEEHRIAATIRRLTNIEDDVSLLVRDQYEENPYPRWIKTPPVASVASVEAYLRQTFPLADFARLSASSRTEILIVGCGTGQQSIRTSQQYPGARILAIDLSGSSLAYAIRKTAELGLSSIEYAQADLLKLDSLGRRFDVIEAGGVLHHLADPWAGWRTLLSLLRPNGFMRLGLYSSIARREVGLLQNALANEGYGTSVEDIRRCRQDLMAALGGGTAAADGKASDLFTISGFRDLLLHVQEHRCSLTEIARFLRENCLTFLGFDIAPDVLHRYRTRFPRDQAATDLTQWHVFENEHPQTFVGMYQFWIQKRIEWH